MRFLLGFAIFTALILPSVSHAAVPQPPHQFYGEGTDGSDFVEATNKAGGGGGSTTIRDGRWLIEFDRYDAGEVQFRISGLSVARGYVVEVGGATAVDLRADSTALPVILRGDSAGNTAVPQPPH